MEKAREGDTERNKLIAAILTNALFTAKLVHLQKGTVTDSKGILEDVFSTWTAISHHFDKETTNQRRDSDPKPKNKEEK